MIIKLIIILLLIYYIISLKEKFNICPIINEGDTMEKDIEECKKAGCIVEDLNGLKSCVKSEQNESQSSTTTTISQEVVEARTTKVSDEPKNKSPSTTNVLDEPNNFQFDISNSATKVDKCNFIPWGPDINFCMNQCENSPIKELYDDNNLCDNVNCYDICNYCNNFDRCQWLSEIKIKPNRDINQNFNIDYIKNIKLEKTTNTLFWDKIDDVDTYMIQYSNQDSQSNINIFNTTKNSIILKNINNISSNILDDTYLYLDGGIQTKYIFIIYGISNNKIKYVSNIMTNVLIE